MSIFEPFLQFPFGNTTVQRLNPEALMYDVKINKRESELHFPQNQQGDVGGKRGTTSIFAVTKSKSCIATVSMEFKIMKNIPPPPPHDNSLFS